MAGDKSLMGAFGTTDFLVPLVLGDLSDEDARKRSRGDEGPSIAWTVGHLLHSRVYVLQTLGRDRENPYEGKFGTLAATDGSDYPTLAELQREWDAVSAELIETLGGTSEEELDRPAPDAWHDGQVTRDKIVFMAWHEGYHIGVIGAIRKSLGYPGPAEKVMEQRAG